jgi:menaquinone-dependent protoporphyrinogen IX oxidase
MNIDVDIKNIREVKSLDYDLIIIGSPIFIGKPMKSVEDFIVTNYENLRNKKIAIFVTCWAMATEYGASSVEFLDQLRKHLPPCDLMLERALPGKLLLDKVSERDQQTMKRLLRRLDAMSEEFNSQEIAWRDARDKKTAEDFGKEIENSFRNYNDY